MSSKRFSIFILLFLSSLLVGLDCFSQPLLLKKKWTGPYDIRMVGSVALQPAFVSSVSPVTVTGFLTDDLMRRSGKSFCLNNAYVAFPNTTNLLPLNVNDSCSVLDLCPDYLVSNCDVFSNNLVRYKTKNSKIALVYADCDDDVTTFQSSWAELIFDNIEDCAFVESAYLYWVGSFDKDTAIYAPYSGATTMKSFNGGAVGGASTDFNTVLFKSPKDSLYTAIIADSVYLGVKGASYKPSYVCVAEVTDYMRKAVSGKYWVANVQSASTNYDTGSGWSLVCVYKSMSNLTRQIVLYDGYDDIVNGKPEEFSITTDYDLVGDDNLSYIGLGVLDSENISNLRIKVDNDTLVQYDKLLTSISGDQMKIKSCVDFQVLNFFAGKDTAFINPFGTDQIPSYFSNIYGVPYASRLITTGDLCSISSYAELDLQKGIDGVTSSKITCYDYVNNKNGAQINRMPSLHNTLGFDIHHLRVPHNIVFDASRLAKLSVPPLPNDVSFLFCSYLALEIKMPNVVLQQKSLNAVINLEKPEVHYQLRAYNVGKASLERGRAFIVDSLDESVVAIKDFHVISSDNGIGASLQSNNIQYDLQTNRPYIKIFIDSILPRIDSLTNAVSSKDTLIIEFVAVLSGTDLPKWKLKCQRFISNIVSICSSTKKDVFVSTSNSTHCDDVKMQIRVDVFDSVFQKFDQRYSMSVDLSESIKAEPKLQALAVLQQLLSDSIRAIGINDVDINKYEFRDELDSVVAVDMVFDTNLTNQIFTATYTSDDGCSEVYTITVLVNPDNPVVHFDKMDVSCFAYQNGSIRITAEKGGVNEIYEISLLKGSFNNSIPASDSLVSLMPSVLFAGGLNKLVEIATVDSLPAGKYTIVVSPTINKLGEKSYMSVTINQPELVKVNLSSPKKSVCTGDLITIYSDVYSTSKIKKEFEWQHLNSLNQWATISSLTTSAIQYPVFSDMSFRLKMNQADCVSISDPISFRVLPTPSISVVPSDTGCFRFDLHNFKVSETSGLFDYDLSLHRKFPNSAVDNSNLIKEVNYGIVQGQYIYARLSVENTCYSVDSGEIIIKPMNECYPIEVPEFFSPDGDGINDLFLIKGIEEYNKPEFIVFDKTGSIVYVGGKDDLSTTSGWDGTYNNKPLPSADYWFQLNFLEIKTMYGHFSLKRGANY